MRLQNIWSTDLWKRMVWICLLDCYGFGFSSIQDSTDFSQKKLERIRYFTFIVSLIFVASLFLFQVDNLERIMFWCFLIGNILYYAIGIALAFAFKDNRAFCKYICPVTVFLKPASYFSLLRIKCDEEKCISCGKCKSVCPMDVDVTDNSRNEKWNRMHSLHGMCKELP